MMHQTTDRKKLIPLSLMYLYRIYKTQYYCFCMQISIIACCDVFRFQLHRHRGRLHELLDE